jgi:hypothetical protein
MSLSLTLSKGQTMKGVSDNDPDEKLGNTKLYILSDVKAATSGSNGSVQSTGTGKLGVSFKSKFFYGSVLFNVFNKNENLTSSDSSASKAFANNLLIPDNSGQGLSNFHGSFGFKSFSKYDSKTNWDDVPLFSLKRIGGYGFWQVNNTTWKKDSLSVPVYISSFGLFLTYNILSLQLLGEDKDKVYLSWFAGYENRILGGDYSLDVNSELKQAFLGTDQRKFKSFPTAGFKVEIGKFYGKVTETHFGDGNIPGFSGWQAVVTVGISVDLNIAAKNSDPTK